MRGLDVRQGGVYLDATVGGGGHLLSLLAAGAGAVVALDQDPDALSAAASRLGDWLSTHSDPLPLVVFRHLNFAEFRLEQHGLRDERGCLRRFDGILADLGVSSPQLDRPERGFSLQREGPLDMRMDPGSSGPTAAELVNLADQEALADWFVRFGEERYARRIARQIVQSRPLQTTTQLAQVVTRAVPVSARHGRIHPATRVFQALRIVVNRELEALGTLLQEAPNWLAPGGKLAVISFHSLEDRLVKWGFRQDPRWQVLTRKPIQPQLQEAADNPRARSAKLRIGLYRDPLADLDAEDP